MLKIASKIENEPVIDDHAAYSIVHHKARKSKISLDFIQDSEHKSNYVWMLIVHHERIGFRDIPAVLSGRGLSKPRDFGAALEWMRENSPPDVFATLEWATTLTAEEWQVSKSGSTLFVARERVDG